MGQPLNKWKGEKAKGLEVVEWEGSKYSIQKSYKKKDSDEWVRFNISLFKNELEELGSLIAKALGEPEVDQMPTPEYEQKPPPFTDDDIPF